MLRYITDVRTMILNSTRDAIFDLHVLTFEAEFCKGKFHIETTACLNTETHTFFIFINSNSFNYRDAFISIFIH